MPRVVSGHIFNHKKNKMEITDIKKNAEFYFKTNKDAEKVFACTDGNLFSELYENDAYENARANKGKVFTILRNGDIIGGEEEEDKPDVKTAKLTIDGEEKEYTAEELRAILDKNEVNYANNTGLEKLAKKVMELN